MSTDTLSPVSATTSPVQAIVQRCEALFEDLEFKSVQQWKGGSPYEP